LSVQLVNFSSLFFVSFTDFIVPWCLYIVMIRNSARHSGAAAAGSIQDTDAAGQDASDTDPLLSGALSKNIPEHFAIPESWGVTDNTKTLTSVFFVVLMGGLAIAATIMQIDQNANQVTAWDCWAVGGS